MNYLVNTEVITFDIAKYLDINTAIVLKKPSFFSTLWNTFSNYKGNDVLSYIVVEQKTLIGLSDDDPKDKKKHLNLVEFKKKGE